MDVWPRITSRNVRSKPRSEAEWRSLRLHNDESGAALVWAIILFTVGSVLLTALLSPLSTNFLATQARDRALEEQYAAGAGIEYAVWTMLNDPLFLETVSLATTPVTLTLPTTVNHISPTVQVENISLSPTLPGRFGSQTPGRRDLLDVRFFNTQVGWAVGQQGLVIKSYDGGWTWFEQNSGSQSHDLTAVFPLSLTDVWAVGAQINPSDAATILHSTDGGETWQTITSPAGSKRLNDVTFVDAAHGWIVGDNGAALRTTDGSTWQILSLTGIPPSEQSRRLNAVFFLEAQVGWIAGEGGLIWATVDGGDNWVSRSSGVNKDLNDVFFIDKNKFSLTSNRGWAVGDNQGPSQSTILYSADGGATWVAQSNIENDSGIEFYAIQVLDPQKGWVAGKNGHIRRTNNGGSNWIFQDSRTNLDLYGLHMLDTSHGWAVGQDGVILVYDGTAWKPQNAFTNQTLNAVWFVDQQHGWVAGEAGTIALTLDGREWITKTNPIIGTANLNGVSFTRPYTGTVGWAVGDGGRLFFSDDGGETWVSQDSTVSVDLNDVSAVNATTAYAVGGVIASSKDAVIIKTTDGSTWNRIAVGNALNKELLGVWFVDELTGWAVGQGGTIIQTSNGGANWSDWTNQTNNLPLSDPQTGKDLYDVVFLDASVGWASGQNATALWTVDGGASWASVPQASLPYNGPVPPILYGVSFPDQSNGFLVGQQKGNVATLDRTSDGGVSWQLLDSGTNQDMYDVFVVDICHGWAVGGSGTILHFFCPPATSAGGCAVFDVLSTAKNTTVVSRVRACGGTVVIDSWQVQ